MNRRQMLEWIGMAGVGLTTAGCASMTRHMASGTVTRSPLGLQLYTIQPVLLSDPAATLKAVAALGYKEVETLGCFGLDPMLLADAVAGAGLTSPSQHLMPFGLEKDFAARVRRELSMAELERSFVARFADMDAMLKEAIGWAKRLGQRYIVWQIVWPSEIHDAAATRAFAKRLNRAGQICADQGLGFAFHNHGNELVPLDGHRPYDLILDHTDPRLVKLEMDICWMASKGADPIAYLRAHPDRYRLCHLKDVNGAGKSVPAGQGIVPFEPIIQACEASGVEHYYVELDAAVEPMKIVSDAADYFGRYLTRASHG